MKIYGLIGKPLGHSFSQHWFNDLFEREGRKFHRYDLFELETIEALTDVIRDTSGLSGLNVTIPYKQSVMPLLDEIHPLAAAVGAVNTIALRNGRTIGYNTDVEGFRSTLVRMLDGAKPRALVLGSGGASRAVAYVLRELGIKFRVVSRSLERGDMTWDMVDPTVVKVCKLIINTTPIGMQPMDDQRPDLPYEGIGADHIMIDLIYNPEQTLFLKEGIARGASVANGNEMLIRQAEAAWRIWNEGASIPS